MSHKASLACAGAFAAAASLAGIGSAFSHTIVGQRVFPATLAIDDTRGLGYIGHFTDSYIGVVDLNQANTKSYGKIILSIGARTPPRAQK